MSDVDDELLALAGGDVSDDASEPSRDGSASPPPPPSAARKKETSSKAAAAKKAPAKRTKNRSQDDESEEEEGEASSVPASPSSQQSAPMEESDSDADSDAAGPAAPPQRARAGGDDDDDMNKYPVDGLFVSHAEKAEIMSMREVEREVKIAERREEIERIRQNRLLRHMVVSNQQHQHQHQHDGSGSRKRKISAAHEYGDGDGDDDDDDDAATARQRKTSRVRTKVGGTRVGETSSGIHSLRRAREERRDRMQQRELERGRRRSAAAAAAGRASSSPLRSPSRDGVDDDSDVEWASPGRSRAKGRRSRSPDAGAVPPTELRDIERVRVGRSRFAEVCFYPGFEEAITGCYVRINIGPDPSTGQDVYRMAVIKGFTKGRPYAMPNRQGHQLVVEAYVKAAHGKAQREWPFISCSDQPFTEAEWNRYQSVLASEGLALPNKLALVNKIDDINRLVHRPWTELELAEKLERQNSLRIKYGGIERDRLEKALRDARAAGNEAKAARLQDELDRLEVPRLAFRTSLHTTRGGSNGSSGGKPSSASAAAAATESPSSQQERLAALNRENRRRNAEAVRRAQLKERARAREIEARLERGEAVEEDHSRRLKTRARFLHDVHDRAASPRSGASTPAAHADSAAHTPLLGATTPAAGPQQVLPHLAKLQQKLQESEAKGSIPTIHKPLMDDDIIGSLDLDIDVEI